jgi:hypothetical protein
MSVEVLENEIVIRIPKEKYNEDVQRLIDAVEKPFVESEFYFDVEAGSSLEELLLEVKKERSAYTKTFLEKAGIIK